MRKKMFSVMIMAVCLLAFAPMATADMVTISNPGADYRDQGFGGGEFTATLLGQFFETFCLETHEYLTLPGTYNYTLSNAAVYGVNGATSGSDPISVGTAWLYGQFIAGTLTGYTFTPGAARAASAKALQQAIWYLEDEDLGVSNSFVDAAALQFATPKANYGGSSIKVLNLWNGTPYESANRVQDVLTPTPIPAAVWLLGSGLLGLFGIRRRLTK